MLKKTVVVKFIFIIAFAILCTGASGTYAQAASPAETKKTAVNTAKKKQKKRKTKTGRSKKIRISYDTMYGFGGIDNPRQSHGKKKISMRKVESHGLRDTYLHSKRSKALFDNYYAYLKKGVDTGRDYFWVLERAGKWPDKERFELEAVIEWELFGYICDAKDYKNPYTDDYTMKAYKKNLQCKKKIEKIARKICKPGMTEREASAVITEYIVRRLKYRTNKQCRDSRAYLALKNHAGNCQAYSGLYKTMCNAVGIKCDLIAGKTDGKCGHTWNRVKIDNKWYYMDLTWFDGDRAFDRSYLYQKRLWPNHKIASIF